MTAISLMVTVKSVITGMTYTKGEELRIEYLEDCMYGRVLAGISFLEWLKIKHPETYRKIKGR
jgi:hypothetical protein